MPFFISGQRPLYYERHGQGPALIFLHGAGSNGATWWQQLPAFTPHFTCYTVDIRCFGRSVAPPEELQIRLLVNDLVTLMDEESIGSAALVGQSLGGMVALRTALEHPARVSALVPCDSSMAIDHPRQVEIIERRLTAAAAMSIEQRSLGAWFIEHRPALVALYAQINHFNPSAHSIPPDTWRQAMLGLNHPESLVPLPALRAVACPVLLLIGREDPIVPLDIVQEVATLIPDAQVTVVEQAAHSAYFEQPEVFNEKVLAFLCQTPTNIK
jgi:3-oxoadipate enol-lactonase